MDRSPRKGSPPRFARLFAGDKLRRGAAPLPEVEKIPAKSYLGKHSIDHLESCWGDHGAYKRCP